MPLPWFVQQLARNGLDNAPARILRGFTDRNENGLRNRESLSGRDEGGNPYGSVSLN